MRLLYFTDLHWRGNSPRARRDVFPETARRKLAEIGELAVEYDVPAVLFGGDLTESHALDQGPESDLMRALRQITRPILAVNGNTHDIPGDNINLIRRTTLNVVESAGLLQLLQPGHSVTLDQDGVTVQISGQGFHQEMDRRDWRLDYCVYHQGSPLAPEGHQHWRSPDVNWSIHIVHGMLRTEPLMAGVPVTVVRDVLDATQADVTVSGHDHDGFGIERQASRWACNPGAVMRKFADEIERSVKVALITLTPDTCTVELLPLKSALPGDEVLDRTAIDTKARDQGNFEQFVAEVKTSGDFEAIDLQTIIQRVAESGKIGGVTDKVRQEALERVALAKEAYDRKAQAEEVA